MEFAVGEKLDNQYEIIGKHVGGMGVVYITRDIYTGKRYAVKTIKPELIRDPTAVARFRAEAYAWINLDHHQHIVQAMLYREVNEQPLLFLEYIEGTDLEHLMQKEGVFVVAQALDFAVQFARGMHYVHHKDLGDGRQGIVHRDIKPGNIMITTNRTIRITDFGLVQIQDAATRLTLEGSGLGTPLYMAPEQLQDARHVDPRADIYSFGAVFYELLTGRKPISGDNLANLLLNVLMQEPPPPRALNPDIPQALEALLLRCLAKRREDRYSSFKEILEELLPLLEESRAHLPEGTRACRLCGFLTRQPHANCPLCEGPLAKPEESAEFASTAMAFAPPTDVTSPVISVPRPPIPPPPEARETTREVALPSEEKDRPPQEKKPTVVVVSEPEPLAPDLSETTENSYVRMGHLMLQEGKGEEAAQMYRLALERDPNAITAQFNLGVILFQQGSLSEAEEQIQAVLEKNPQYDRARRALEHLRRTTPPTGPLISGTAAGEIWVCPKDGSRMALVPAGVFLMGSNEHDRSERPQRSVYLDAFYIDLCAVTQAQFMQFVEDTGYKSLSPWRQHALPGREHHPVTYVTHADALAYCEWAGKRLPTEAEWEKAARGTDGRIYPWGNEWDTRRVNCAESGFGETVPVDSYPGGASPYGCLNMVGNVWEWCADWYDPHYYLQAPDRNPTGPETGKFRVLRGGSYLSHLYENDLRCSARGSIKPEERLTYIRGFRCAKTP